MDVARAPLDGGEHHRVDHADDRAVIAREALDGEAVSYTHLTLPTSDLV